MVIRVMEKEIKFRVWDIQKEKFIPNDVYAILNRTDFNAFGIMIKDWENYCEGEYFYDDAQILQWYSGVKDKNNVEIYEGDRVILGGSVEFVVEFIDGAFRFKNSDTYILPIDLPKTEEIEIIE